jgi:acyl dehydratase
LAKESPTLLWEDVIEGADLPSFQYELSQLRLVAFVRATGLYDFIHFDRDYARSLGARDAFAANSHLSGLLARLLSDWAGPEGELHAMNFTMRAQCCAGDMLTVGGKVGRKYRGDDGQCLVDLVDLHVSIEGTPGAASATATMALPSRGDGPVRPRSDARVADASGANENTPDFARDLIGRTRPVSYRTQPLVESELHLWCEALEDWNPLYWDHAYAAASRHGGLVAPPLAQLYGAGSSVNIGVGHGKPGADVPVAIDRGLTGLDLLRELRLNITASQAPLSLSEFPEIVIADSRIECFRPFRVGDELSAEQTMLTCSPLKKTRLGQGHFISWINAEFNQHQELVRTVGYMSFMYRLA